MLWVRGNLYEWGEGTSYSSVFWNLYLPSIRIKDMTLEWSQGTLTIELYRAHIFLIDALFNII